jgi:hypothetical protein
MCKKKNKIVPLSKPEEKYKFKSLKHVDECDKLSNFFKTRIKVEMGNRTYVTNFYIAPRPTKNKCCKIL